LNNKVFDIIYARCNNEGEKVYKIFIVLHVIP
jgi:hypothetical protein